MHKRPFIEEQETSSKLPLDMEQRLNKYKNTFLKIVWLKNDLDSLEKWITAIKLKSHFVFFTDKRFREDVDSVASITNANLRSPLQAATVNRVAEARSTISIPVIEEPKRKPSMPKFVIETDSVQEKKQRCSLLGVMDDPEIDLTDGPIDVKVELCNRQFYLSNYKKVCRLSLLLHCILKEGFGLTQHVNKNIHSNSSLVVSCDDWYH